MKKNKRKYRNKEVESKIAVEKKSSRRMKLTIIISIIALIILSAAIFVVSLNASQGSVTMEFTTHTLGNDNSITQGEHYLVAGKQALLTFRLTDNKTGQSISGLNPEINFYSPETGESATEHKHFFANYYKEGEISLAKIQLFVLNSERGTIEVLDTFGDYGTSSNNNPGTEASKSIMLKGSPGQKTGDLLAGRYGDYAYATLSGENQVAVVNTVSRKVEKYIDVGVSPGLMFSQPESKYLWVSNDGSISIIDTDSNILAKTIETGKGFHQVAFSPANAYVTNSEDNTITVIRLDGLAKQRDIGVEIGSYGIDYSKISHEVYAANILQGTVAVIDAESDKIKGHIPLSQGVEIVKFSPDGRLGIFLNPYANVASIIDAATDRLIRNVNTGAAPNAIAFMDEYALICNTYSRDVTYISMLNSEEYNNAPIGRSPPINVTRHSIQILPSGDEAVITNPMDGSVYFMHTMEGEPMEMGSTNVEYGSDAVAVIENKLHETSQGVYQQYITLNRAGLYNIEFKSQKVNATFKIEILPEEKEDQITITPLFKTMTFRRGNLSTLQYRITDRKTGQPVENLTDMTFLIVKPNTSKGTWTRRAAPAYTGNGTYELKIVFPQEEDYMVTLNSNTLQSMGYETTYDHVAVKNSTIG